MLWGLLLGCERFNFRSIDILTRPPTHWRIAMAETDVGSAVAIAPTCPTRRRQVAVAEKIGLKMQRLTPRLVYN